MTASKKLMSAVGDASEPIYVDSLFSTYLYTGNGSTQTITNGINLADEGGVVWLKNREQSSRDHRVFDTERGIYKSLFTNLINQEDTSTSSLTAFNSDGFTLSGFNAEINDTDLNYASWTFRKQAGFFDIVTYAGDGAYNRAISHNLGCDVGAMFVKKVDGSSHWFAYNKGAGAKVGRLNETYAWSSSEYNNVFNSSGTEPTSSQFYVGGGNPNDINQSGYTYIVYLFADGDDADAQIFGTGGDQAVVKCGSYTGNGSDDGPEIDLGFEPQWLLTVNTSLSTEQWHINDSMRGVVTGGSDARLEASRDYAEAYGTMLDFTSTGFKPNSYDDKINGNGYTYTYIAIRRPHKPAESGSEVFAIDTRGSTGDGNFPAFRADFPVDMSLSRSTSADNWRSSGRLIQGKNLITNSTGAESDNSLYAYDYNNGWYDVSTTVSSHYSWMFKRSPGFFDVVAYTGAGATQTINHNLGVKPEAILIKQRTGTTGWIWWYDAFGDNQTFIRGDLTNATFTNTTYFNNTAPTDTQITLGFHSNVSGTTSTDYIAYLFASQDGISKVGSYTGNGTTQNIDCGFSSGARFVLIKSVDTEGNWWLYDSVRGIVSGNDPRLYLNTTDAEYSLTDYIDPDSSGFIVKGTSTQINSNGDNFIYLAIA